VRARARACVCVCVCVCVCCMRVRALIKIHIDPANVMKTCGVIFFHHIEVNAVKFDYRYEPVRFGCRGCFPQVVFKVARIPMGNLNFGRSSSHIRICVCVMYTRAYGYVGPRRLDLLCAGMGCGSQYHRGMTPAGSTPYRSFPPFPVLFASARKQHHLRHRHRPHAAYLQTRSARSLEIP